MQGSAAIEGSDTWISGVEMRLRGRCGELVMFFLAYEEIRGEAGDGDTSTEERAIVLSSKIEKSTY